MKKRITAAVTAAIMSLTTLLSPVFVYADRIEDQPYISLGADLTEEQKGIVLDLMDVNAAELDQYTVYEVTNEEEHQYLGSYLDPSVIGTKSLSSVKVVGREDGHGIRVTTTNISYCTPGMYQNALATAGLEDADVTVVGPVPISGTAALVGAVKAYSAMTGEVIEPELIDGATNELVVTSKLAESIGSAEKAEGFMAAIKEIIAANEFNTEEEINKVIDDVAAEMGIQLTEEDKQLIRDLVDKLSKLDLDFDEIKEQAKELYDKISNIDLSKYGVTQESVEGFLGRAAQFFKKLIDALAGLFD